MNGAVWVGVRLEQPLPAVRASPLRIVEAASERSARDAPTAVGRRPGAPPQIPRPLWRVEMTPGPTGQSGASATPFLEWGSLNAGRA
jgi:hypothetical protein